MNAMIEIDKKQLTALILAGGKSSRMEGNDKGLLQINNKYIIQYLHSLAEKFCTDVLVNVNKNVDQYNRPWVQYMRRFNDWVSRAFSWNVYRVT